MCHKRDMKPAFWHSATLSREGYRTRKPNGPESPRWMSAGKTFSRRPQLGVACSRDRRGMTSTGGKKAHMTETSPPPHTYPEPVQSRTLKATRVGASAQTSPACWLGSHHQGMVKAIHHGLSRGDSNSSRDAGPFLPFCSNSSGREFRVLVFSSWC